MDKLLLEELKLATGKENINYNEDIAVSSDDVKDGILYIVKDKNYAIVKGGDRYLTMTGEDKGTTNYFDSIKRDTFIEVQNVE